MRKLRNSIILLLAIFSFCILRERYLCHRGQVAIYALRSNGCWVVSTSNGRSATLGTLLGDDEYRHVEQIHLPREIAVQPEHATAFPGLTTFVAVENIGVNARSLRALLGHPRLVEIDLRDANILMPDETFAKVFREIDFRAAEIRSIHFTDSRFGDRELLRLAEISNLENLDISDTSVTAVGVSSLHRCTRLRFLGIARVPVDRSMVNALSSLKSLQILNLDYTHIGDGDVQQLCRSLLDLRFISLAGTQVTRKSLPSLADAELLRDVDLADTSVVASDLNVINSTRRKCFRLTDVDFVIGDH